MRKVPPKPLLAVVIALLTLLAGRAGASTPHESGRAAAEERRYDPDHVLVGFRPGTPERGRADAHRREDGRVDNRFDHLNLDVVRVREGEDPPVVAQRYQRNPNVAYAHPNWEVELLGAPNDLLFGALWGLHNTGQDGGTSDADIDAPEGWDVAFGENQFPSSGGISVGVLDTGIDLTHVDLLDKTKACARAVSGIGIVEPGVCSDDHGHGTHVAGTVAAIANNTVGVAGVAPNAELAVFKALFKAPDGRSFGFYADIGDPGRDVYLGFGRVNLQKALGPAAPGTIAGTVTDAKTKAGIGRANVDCGAGGKAHTATDGPYRISNVLVGTYTCTASATGYLAKSQKNVIVNSNQTTTANFTLHKQN